jgi:hypothetical protein
MSKCVLVNVLSLNADSTDVIQDNLNYFKYDPFQDYIQVKNKQLTNTKFLSLGIGESLE